MGRKRLTQYRGQLSAEKIAEGINAAKRNAQRLAEDARLLLNAGRFPSAAALAILSIEESGKPGILRGLALADDEGNEAWRDFRSHTKKNILWIMPDLVAKGARKLDDFLEMFDDDSDHPNVLDQIKQVAIYTDCLGKSKWSEPEKAIECQFAETLVRAAEGFIGKKETSAEEIELWRKHIGPVKNTGPDWIKNALRRWYSEMQERGLAPPGENEAEIFIKGERNALRDTGRK